MFEGIASRDSFTWDPLEALFNEICSIFQIIFCVQIELHMCRSRFQHIQKINFLVPFQSAASFEEVTHILLDELPFIMVNFILGWRTKDLLHFDYLEAFSVTRKHWRPGEKLEYDAACCPNVNGVIILVACKN